MAGQSFIPHTLDKIRALRAMIEDRGLSTLIEIDGGVSPKTIEAIAAAGTDVFVAGSAIFGSDNYAKTIGSFRSIINTAEGRQTMSCDDLRRRFVVAELAIIQVKILPGMHAGLQGHAPTDQPKGIAI